MNVGTLQQNGSVERAFVIFDSTQMVAEEQVHVLFLDPDIRRGVRSLWAEALSWTFDTS